MPSATPATLRTLGEYEATLADVQRAYKRLTAARGPDRAPAEAAYAAAMRRARDMGARVQALDGRAA